MRSKSLMLGALGFAFVCCFIFSLGVGHFELSYAQIPQALYDYFYAQAPLAQSIVFVESRLVRVIAAVCVGGALALSGGLYQGIIGNPLVSPSILGVLSGASFGAALGMVFGFGIVGIEIMCFVFGVCAFFLSLLLAFMFDRSLSLVMLILGGMISGAFFGAALSALKLLADPYNTLPSIVFWLMGSLAYTQPLALGLLGVVLVLSVLISIVYAQYVDILHLDEQSAASLGLSVKYARVSFMFIATLLASLSVALAGIIGWVGLVIPHISRFIIGANHRFLLPFCTLFGAVFLLLCDDIARAAFGIEVPLGIVSAALGIPCFVLVLCMRKR